VGKEWTLAENDAQDEWTLPDGWVKSGTSFRAEGCAAARSREISFPEHQEIPRLRSTPFRSSRNDGVE